MPAATTDPIATSSDETFVILETLAAPSMPTPGSVASGDDEDLTDRKKTQQSISEGKKTNLKGWRAEAFIKFTEIVKKAKGAASVPVVHFMKNL